MGPGGRPALFNSAKELEEAITAYFNHCKTEPEIITITGMAYFLGFESRQSFYDYAEKGEFSYLLKRVRLKVESEYEKRVNGTTPTGPIFVLKNMGWKDTQEIKHDINKSVITLDPLDDTSDHRPKEDSPS